MTPQEIEQIFKIWEKENPKPHTELIYSNPYQLLVAVLLSAQMTDTGVNKATQALFQKVTHPQEMLDLGLEELLPYIKTINYYPTKGKHILEGARILVQEYHGTIPNTREGLEALPGIGRKSANVILNSVFGKSTIGVDTHVFRVSHHLGLARGKTPLAVEKELERLIPAQYRKDAHHWLVLHGRYICQAKKPQCEKCSIAKYCQTFHCKGRSSQLRA